MNYNGHQHISRKLLTAFMDFLNGIYIEKYSWDETLQDFVPRARYKVPVQFSGREKLMQINESSSARKVLPIENSLAPVEMQLIVPRIAVNLTGVVFDSDRHTNKMNEIRLQVGKIYAPVPYNLELEVSTITKTMDDSFQILEQIVPFFASTMSLDVNTYLDIVESIPVALTSVTFDFPQELAETDDRLFEMSFFFSIRANYYLQRKSSTLIRHATANVFSDGQHDAKIQVDADDVTDVVTTVITNP